MTMLLADASSRFIIGKRFPKVVHTLAVYHGCSVLYLSFSVTLCHNLYLLYIVLIMPSLVPLFPMILNMQMDPALHAV